MFIALLNSGTLVRCFVNFLHFTSTCGAARTPPRNGSTCTHGTQLHHLEVGSDLQRPSQSRLWAAFIYKDTVKGRINVISVS